MENKVLKEHYLLLLRQMCPTMSEEKSDKVRLVILKRRTAQLIEMLTLFEHSWVEEVPVLQKACLSFLATEGVSRKERQQIVEAWTSWSDFMFRLARYRGLLSQFLQYHHRTEQELESLLNTGNTEIPDKSIIQEGGI